LKEFGDFETYYTPTFRHPPIMGIESELDDIGLLREIKGLNLLCATDPVVKNVRRKEYDENLKTVEEKLKEKM
jgi:hypothetical protein